MNPQPIPPQSEPGPQPGVAFPPLAEGRWLWRRIYVFGASLELLGLLAAAVGRSTVQTCRASPTACRAFWL